MKNIVKKLKEAQEKTKKAKSQKELAEAYKEEMIQSLNFFRKLSK